MTITVTSLAARNGGEEILVTVRLSDGEHEELRRFVLTTAQYAEMKPQKGEITEAQFDALEEAAEIGSAIRKGSGILAFGANSKRTLVQKLRRRGFDAERATAAAEYLAEHKCLDESADAPTRGGALPEKALGTAADPGASACPRIRAPGACGRGGTA